MAIGLLEDVEITVIYTTRGETIRIISARRARRNERMIDSAECLCVSGDEVVHVADEVGHGVPDGVYDVE